MPSLTVVSIIGGGGGISHYRQPLAGKASNECSQ
jgi:hypothetical protein